ncbi:hypothetical protein ECPA14_2264, partial [Escherichia coli PA14]|jgi:SRSO17 transposase
MDV